MSGAVQDSKNLTIQDCLDKMHYTQILKYADTIIVAILSENRVGRAFGEGACRQGQLRQCGWCA